MISRMRAPWLRTAALAAILAACGGGDDSAGPGGTEGVNSYLTSLPDWASFAPAGVQRDSAVDSTRSAVQSQDTVATVQEIDPTGNLVTRQNVVYACTSVPYTMAKNPREVVIYNPDVDILWPGALIQGKTHKDPVGSLLPLTIAERSPVNVSIPGFQVGNNFRTVDTVDQAHVAGAIGSIVGNATASNLQAPAASTFEMRTYNSEQEFALQVGLSGKYLGFSGSASGSINRNSSETTVAVQFYQRMFDVVVAPPPTPGDFFSTAFTPEKLEQQKALGRIGPDNLPVYVSQVTYGRMMMFTLTSTASESDIRATLNASYKFVTGQAGLQLDAMQTKILTESKIAITAIGGNDQATAAMIRSGDWRAYFTASAPLSSAAPISYAFRNLGDGSLAQVTEAVNYSIKTCTETSTLPGQFTFQPVQNITAPVAAPFETRLVDATGDGYADLVWNHRSPGLNQVAVAPGQGDGSFGAPVTATHPVDAAEGWGNFVLTTGDFSGDGRIDLAWTYLSNGVNKSYVALSTGGGWSFATAQVRPETGNWTGLKVVAGDTDGDGDDDLVFNLLSTANHVYVNLSNGDGSFDMTHPVQVHPASGWSAYQVMVGDVNEDGRADLIWNSVGLASPNRTYTGRFNANGVTYAAASPAFQDHPAVCCWSTYQRLVGDFDGDGDSDLYFNNMAAGARALHGGRASGSGTWTFLNPYQSVAEVSAGAYLAHVADIDGDGASDIVWNLLGSSTNRIQTARGKTNGYMDVTLTGQLHPASTNWSQALLLTGRTNPDTRDDLVWVIPGSSVQVFVALSRP